MLINSSKAFKLAPSAPLVHWCMRPGLVVLLSPNINRSDCLLFHLWIIKPPPPKKNLFLLSGASLHMHSISPALFRCSWLWCSILASRTHRIAQYPQHWVDLRGTQLATDNVCLHPAHSPGRDEGERQLQNLRIIQQTGLVKTLLSTPGYPTHLQQTVYIYTLHICKCVYI